jgi:hypothetical protein
MPVYEYEFHNPQGLEVYEAALSTTVYVIANFLADEEGLHWEAVCHIPLTGPETEHHCPAHHALIRRK